MFIALRTILTAIVYGVLAAQVSSLATDTTLSLPAGTIVGSVIEDVEYFRGIPFAAAPTGSLRLKPPVRLQSLGTVQATGVGPSCPQMTNAEYTALLEEAVSIPQVLSAVDTLSPAPNITEDCLTMSVMRPKDTAQNASLPVLFWIYGGGFEVGTSTNYNGSIIVPQSVAQGQPLIFVAVNYRLGGFGFLPGAEVLADGAANLGLLDQRMGLEWVADNIALFGGDPRRVTIWGESAGAFSIFDQMALYDGNITYKSHPLFRAGIMNSGSIYPTESIDSPRAQAVFDTVVAAAGCSDHGSANKLECLRQLDFESYWNATNVFSGPFGYNSPASFFTIRPDGHLLSASSEVLAQNGQFAAVPIIIGDQEDEGTFLSLTQDNITTRDDLINFLHNIVFQNATLQQVSDLVDTYPYGNGSIGSPFGSGTSNEESPEYKRHTAIVGDTTFTLLRRMFLSWVPSSTPAWSYLATYDRGLPIVGTFHTDDLPRIFYGTDDVSVSIQSRYIAFVDALNPNQGLAAAPSRFQTSWPSWHEAKDLLEFGANSTGIISDDFRNTSYQYLMRNLASFRV